MSRRSLWRSITIAAASIFIVWVCWTFVSSAPFGSCIHQRKNYQAYQALHKEELFVIQFFVRLRLHSVCAAHVANVYQGAITAVAGVVVAIFTTSLWISTHLLWESAEAQRDANERAREASSIQTLQSLALAKEAADAAAQNAKAAVAQAGHLEQSAMQAVRAADAMNQQRELMRGQQEIMASQRDISFATRRAWVGVVIKATGPIQFVEDTAFAAITLELWNSGELPARVDSPDLTAYPWGSTEPTQREEWISERISRYRKERVGRGSVILPHQVVTDSTHIAIRASEIERSVNTLGGFVIAIRGAVRYDFPGTSEVHSTTFHALISRNPNPAMPYGVRPIPTDGSVLSADEVFVSYLMGETDAT